MREEAYKNGRGVAKPAWYYSATQILIGCKFEYEGKFGKLACFYQAGHRVSVMAQKNGKLEDFLGLASLAC